VPAIAIHNAESNMPENIAATALEESNSSQLPLSKRASLNSTLAASKS
jgi:hypothetical protein